MLQPSTKLSAEVFLHSGSPEESLSLSDAFGPDIGRSTGPNFELSRSPMPQSKREVAAPENSALPKTALRDRICEQLERVLIGTAVGALVLSTTQFIPALSSSAAGVIQVVQLVAPIAAAVVTYLVNRSGSKSESP